MTVLITGGSGFIGTHLIPELRREEFTVVSTDRDAADLAIPGQAAQLIGAYRPSYVVHLAARYGRLLCRDEPHRAVADNAAATTELAAACAKNNIPVLYASSSEVYGDHGTDTITEESELRTPTTIYGLSKRWGEEVLRLYLPPENLCIVRLNMLFGPEQRGGYGCCALATFIRDALEGRPIQVHRNTSRSWLYITDAVKALRLLIEDKAAGIWNLGNSHERLSMNEVAGLVCGAVGDIGPQIELSDPPADQIAHKNYATSKIEALGWMPEVDLREGIEQTVEAARVHGMRDYTEREAPIAA